MNNEDHLSNRTYRIRQERGLALPLHYQSGVCVLDGSRHHKQIVLSFQASVTKLALTAPLGFVPGGTVVQVDERNCDINSIHL